MGTFYVRGNLLGNNVGEAADNISDADARELLLDYMATWDVSPIEMIATGDIFRYTRRSLVREALEDVEKYGVSHGKVEYRRSGEKRKVDCGCGKTRCTRCGKCDSKNLAPRGTANRSPSKKASAKKTGTQRRS